MKHTTWRVNDYDLQIQHNEALDLACEFIGVTRTRTDSFFEGTRGKRLVKIIPFNHPLTPLDLDSIKQELERRPEEERDIEVVALGMELAARAWLENYNRNRPLNKFHLIELRTDAKYGGFIKHEPLEASVVVQRVDDNIKIEITDVFSPTIVKRLNMEQGLFRAQIDDWRAVVDCVLIDTDYDGEVFNIRHADVPEKKTDLVQGQYSLPATKKSNTVAIKIIDMLGEELIVTAGV
jgi:adenine-specific DNA-methyltransferase